MIRVTVHAGFPTEDFPDHPHGPSSKCHGEINQWDMEQALASIGREYRGADYLPTRQVVIVLDPVTPADEKAHTKALIREAMRKLEETGLA